MLAAPVFLIATACAFPEITFGPAETLGEGGAQSESGGQEVGTDASDAGQDFVDVVSRPEGGGAIDADICETRPKCDCDNDEYADENCDVDAAGLKSFQGNPLKPGDCDDLDDLRHPDQSFVETAPPSGKDGDWDCSKTVEYIPKQNIQCAGSGLLGCTGGPGFVTAPPCGTKATYYTCQPQSNLAATCVPQPSSGEPITEACK